MNANWILLSIIYGLALPALGQQSLDSAYRTTGTAVLAAFEPQRKVLQTSSAVLLDGRKEIGYGVVISSEGLILAKASEVDLVVGLSVTVDQTTYRDVKVLAEDPLWDVVLLKIEASGLVPVVFASTSDLAQGTWVVANGATTRTTRRALAGIISAKSREIPASGGAALGVTLKPNSKILEVLEAHEKSGASDAGLKNGDVILSIDGKAVRKIEELGELLRDRKAGSTIQMIIRREGKEISLDVRLSAYGELFTDQMNRNDQMSGEYSSRRSGFPRVIQHDILGSRHVQGGPLLDLDGRCVGMNIARANRAESFAIPVVELKQLAETLVKQTQN